jgi:hypothetical protein
MHRFVLWFLARFRLSDQAVCEMSKDKGVIDYHDYPDTSEGEPEHFSWLVCKRCGKKFLM